MKKILLLVSFAIASIGVHGQIPSYMPVTGLLAWYSFTGNTNDSSGYLNNGVPYGGVVYDTDRFGIPNSCFHADSLSVVDFPINNFPTGNDPRTVSVFFKLDSPYANGNRELFAWGNNSFVGGRFGLEIFNDTLIGWESVGGSVLAHFTPDTLWHNLIVTYPDSGAGTASIKLYVDGKLATITTISAPVSLLNTPFGPIHCAGSLVLSYLYGFYGCIDDIGIWDHELTSCEVETIYYGPKSIVPKIAVKGDTLKTDSIYTSYQWIKNDTPITGATNNIYITGHDGVASYKVAVVTPGGCLDTSLFYAATLNVNTTSPQNDISIYPNPSRDIFYIKSPISLNIVLANIDGRIIKKIDNAQELHLSGLPNGTYLVSMYDGHGVRMKTERIDWFGN